jgi:signal transduction histidine kinase
MGGFLGLQPAICREMSTSLDTIYKKMASSMEHNGSAMHEPRFDPNRHISPVVAHELNNIITIIMGYGERILARGVGDPANEAHLKLIVEASRRAASIVRDATPVVGSKPLAGAGMNGAQPKSSTNGTV